MRNSCSALFSRTGFSFIDFRIMKKEIKAQRLVSISILFGILFSFPVISIFNFPELVAGIPLLYLYIFSVWILLIVVLFLMLKSGNKSSKEL